MGIWGLTNDVSRKNVRLTLSGFAGLLKANKNKQPK